MLHLTITKHDVRAVLLRPLEGKARVSGGQKFPSHDKFHTVVLKLVRNSSQALKSSYKISRVKLPYSYFPPLTRVGVEGVDRALVPCVEEDGAVLFRVR